MGEDLGAFTVDSAGQVHAPAAKRERTRSLIEFPYSDLKRAVELAQALGKEGGAGSLEIGQLAASLNQSVDGGTFRGRLSAAKMFGFIESRQGHVISTPLGRDILDDTRAASAKIDAFLRVPLYAAIYEKYSGYALPPAAAIERHMASLGVPAKQVERARQAFLASADTAGYINKGNGRFIKPTKPAPAIDDELGTDDSVGGGGGGDTPPFQYSAAMSDKALEYKLVDLMKEGGIGEEERKAIWTLIQYLTNPDRSKAADHKSAA